MTVEELEDVLEGALARIKRLENALLKIASSGEPKSTALALEAMKSEDDD